MKRLALALLLAGCQAPPPVGCLDAVVYEGVPTATLGVRDERGVSWSDGDELALELGPQGGFMVQPVLVLDPAELPPEMLDAGGPSRLCARLEIENIDPTGEPRFEGFSELSLPVTFARDAGTGRYTSPVIANQLRWGPLPPGTAYRFVATARFPGFAAAVRRELTLR